MLDFEWDEAKSERTRKDRGISFNDASKLWSDPDSIEIQARTEGELRFAKIGNLNGHIFICIYTQREAKIRIISVRRAHLKEVAIYEQN